MGKYYIRIVDNKNGDYPIENHNGVSINIEQYTELLLNLSEVVDLQELLKHRLFSCGKCRSFSIAAQSLYSVLTKIDQNEIFSEIIAPRLKEITDIHPLYFDLLGKPKEIIEKYVADDDVFYEIQRELQAGNFVIEDGEVFRYPFEECIFIFDEKCSCSRIMNS